MSERVTLPRTVVDQVLEALGNVGLSGALAQAEQAQEALCEALIDDESAYQRGYMDGMSKGRRDLVAEYPLERDLYDSKDWRCGGYAERVEWLHTMYEAAREEVARLEADKRVAPNLRCKSEQARLATLWGYEKADQPKEVVAYEYVERRPYGAPGEIRRGTILLEHYRNADGIIAGDWEWLIQSFKNAKTTISLRPLYAGPYIIEQEKKNG